MEQHSFGYWLKLKRKALDLSREQLAERVGYSAATIRKIEDEERRPSVQVVERLAEVFHIPPDERTSFLRFARGHWNAGPSEGIESFPWRARARSTLTNLPATITSLVGREKESVDVRDYLLDPEIRLVTLTGPPGIGKTRLSIEAARMVLYYFPEGVFFVALAPLEDQELIALTITQALGYVGARATSTLEQLREGIAEKQMLIVLDNCEHLIEAVASLASELLPACPHLKLLTTSRESLRIPGEWLYPVPAFEVPREASQFDLETASQLPALKLFAERARAVHPGFALHAENIKPLSDICARLDGLPLAIELIAARVRLMSPEALLTRMNEQFILSADGMRVPSPRQKTLNGAIGWSFRLLSEDEQKLFVYLSVFSGGFPIDAAEAMFVRSDASKPVSRLIDSLLDKSLLQVDSAHSLYTMLATIREFARTHLQQRGEEIEIHNRHLAYFLDLAERADKELRGHNQLEWLYRLELVRDNLRSALDWAIETGQTERALRMARNLHWFWFVRGDHIESSQWLQRVLDMPDTSSYPEAHAEALTQLAHHTWLQTGPKEAKPLVKQALSVARLHRHQWVAAKAMVILGLVYIYEPDFAQARSNLEAGKVLFQEIGDSWGYAHALMGLALQSFRQEDLATSVTLHEQALTLFRELGDRYFQSAALRQIGNLRVRQGNLTGGLRALRDALLLAQELKGKFEIYAVIGCLAEADQLAEDPARAARLYWAAKNIAESVGAWWKDDERDFAKNLALCRAMLSEEEFAEAVEEGRSMTMEQAITYALED